MCPTTISYLPTPLSNYAARRLIQTDNTYVDRMATLREKLKVKNLAYQLQVYDLSYVAAVVLQDAVVVAKLVEVAQDQLEAVPLAQPDVENFRQNRKPFRFRSLIPWKLAANWEKYIRNHGVFHYFRFVHCSH